MENNQNKGGEFLLKKVVVVVGEHKEIFEAKEGKNLAVFEHPSRLEVQENEVTLASFNIWTYWRQIE